MVIYCGNQVLCAPKVSPRCRFALDELGAGDVRFTVTPINCFGARGKPLVSAWNMI